MNRVKQVLKDYFGFSEFRQHQEEIIRAILNKQDTLAIMPTGGGKSLCYQIPAILFQGLTIVISPLISLMEDQVYQLNELGIPAMLLNSSLSSAEYSANVNKIVTNQGKLLYLAPETLLKERILSMLSSLPVDCITVDEAHCISEWGHDFRPEYRSLVTIRDNFPDAVWLALTATATPRVQQDIIANLKLQAPAVFISSFNRKNLFLQIIPKKSPLIQVTRFLEKFPDQSGIIYCFSRRQVDELYNYLDQKGYSVLPYHAGLTDIDRKINQDQFIKDDVQIIIATIAFGMGINKPNVRFVIHFDLPKNIESYYQEIGRAGRDGLNAHCLLLFSYGDISKIKYFISQKTEEEQRIAQIHLSHMIGYAETDFCRRLPLLGYFGETSAESSCGMCDNCLQPKKDLIDITIQAKHFLSCVKRTGQIFGINHIIDVLRGSHSDKILANNHQQLEMYGAGKDLSKNQWLHLGRQLIQQGLIMQDIQYGSLKITSKAYETFIAKKPVFGTITESVEILQKKPASPTRFDSVLFNQLRSLRKKIADAKRVPPYVIFSDKTLQEMASYYPQSMTSMKQISGIGKARAKMYGQVFMDKIIDYCQPLKLKDQMQHTSIPEEKPLKVKRYMEVGQWYNQGKSIETMMQLYNVTKETIVNNLLKYLLEGHPLQQTTALCASSALSLETQQKILDLFTSHGCHYLKPIHEKLGATVTYAELTLMKLIFLTNHSH
jgi:ATP-dependent DNA helicase RecQ